MAGITTSTSYSETPQPPQYSEPTVQQTIPGPGTQQAQRGQFGAFVLNSILPPALGENGEKHRIGVEQILKNHGLDIRTYSLPAPYVGTMYVKNNKGVILVYPETIGPMKDADVTPVSSIIPNVVKHAALNYIEKAKHLITQETDFEILDTIPVFEEDYANIRQYANDIASKLVHNQDDGDSTFLANLNALSPESYKINTNRTELEAFLRMYSPHTVLDRMDTMFGLDIFYDGQWRTIAVQGAYIEFLPAPNQQGYNYSQNVDKYVPFIHIIPPVTLFPNLNILGLMLPLAVMQFGHAYGWIEPFATFAADQPNLGSLFDNGSGQPDFIADRARLEYVVRTAFIEPVYVLDVQHGRSNIPNIQWFADPSNNARIGERFARFFGRQELMQHEYVLKVYREITGAMTLDGRKVDTRKIDYFHMSKNLAGAELEKFRLRGSQVSDRIRDIRDVYRNVSDIESRYLNSVCFLNGVALGALGASIANRINLISTERMHQTGITNTDISRIVGSYGQPIPTNFNITTPNNGGFGGGYNSNYANQNNAYYTSPYSQR